MIRSFGDPEEGDAQAADLDDSQPANMIKVQKYDRLCIDTDIAASLLRPEAIVTQPDSRGVFLPWHPIVS